MTTLHAIVDADAAGAAGWAPAVLGQAFLDGGALWLQVRAKRLASGAFLELCEALVTAAEPYGASVIVNDRADVARLSGAAGVHVGQDDVPPTDVRRLLGATAVVGYSTHTLAQIDEAAREPISYLAIGPVFGTTTKETGYAAVGLGMVAQAASRAQDRPVVAIGGITLDTAASVIGAGASAVAVIGDLLTGGQPSARVRAYLQHLSQYRV